MSQTLLRGAISLESLLISRVPTGSHFWLKPHICTVKHCEDSGSGCYRVSDTGTHQDSYEACFVGNSKALLGACTQKFLRNIMWCLAWGCSGHGKLLRP